jgi:glycosyltransferase involved in cell wall biosynthesis
MPRVSVIIPAYHHAAFIGEAIDSVLAQTYRDFEIIVVNDGSPDETEEVLLPYIESGKIRYFRQENQGAAAARNRGVKMAEGEFIAFLDDDDQWMPDKLEWQLSCFDEADVVMVGGMNDSERHLCSKGECDSCRFDVLTAEDFFRRNPIGSPGQTLIRRSAFDAVGGFDHTIWGADDLDLWIRLSQLGEIRKYRRLALHYRYHAGNASLDRIHLAQHIKKVICKNRDICGKDRSAYLDRLGHRSLFNYSSKKTIWWAAAKLISGRFQGVASRLGQELSFYEDRFFKDPLLMGMLIMSLIKIPLRIRKYL